MYSTAAMKSSCITLGLYIMSTSSTSATFLDATVSRGHPAIHLPPILSSLSTTKETASSGKNTSVHYTHTDSGIDYNAPGDDDEFNLLDILPPELAAIIESASSFDSSLRGTTASSRPSSLYYPTYMDGESCSTKSSSEFNSWETHYDTLDECCAKAFGWDYDACMNVKKLSYQTK